MGRVHCVGRRLGLSYHTELRVFLEGQGDLMMGTTGPPMRLIGVIDRLS